MKSVVNISGIFKEVKEYVKANINFFFGASNKI